MKTSINVLIPKMLLSSSIKSLDLATIDAHVWTIGFNTLKTIISKGIVAFASYLEARQIQPHVPNSFP
jgi:hypothetical protein